MTQHSFILTLLGIALKRSPDKLAAYQKKLYKVDDHMGVGMSGLTADGRSLVKYMRTETLNHRYVYGTPMQGSRLVTDLADMHQRCTQSYVRRPYGVGLLVATYDQTGPHLFMTEPSGNYYEYVAMAIGSRSQTSRTYLEKEFEDLGSCSLDDLIKHALKALAVSLSGDVELDAKSASIGVVGKGMPFQLIDGPALQPYLDSIVVEADVEVASEALVVDPDA
jgi:20S proteasome subunit alpha 6